MATKPRVSLPEGAGDDPINGSPLALQPDTLAAFNQLYGTLWSRGELKHQTKEIARLRNARTTGCTFCKSVRFSRAVDEGLVEAKVEQINDDFETSELSDQEKLVLRYTDTFLHNPSGMTSELREAMGTEFSPAEIVELTVGLATFMGFSKLAVSLGGMPESLPVSIMPTPE